MIDFTLEKVKSADCCVEKSDISRKVLKTSSALTVLHTTNLATMNTRIDR